MNDRSRLVRHVSGSLILVLLMTLLPAVVVPAQAPLVNGVIINEVDADTESTDALEFVELYDGGAGNSPLDGLVVVFFNGNGDTSYYAADLDGYVTDASGYFVLGNAAVPGVDLIFPGNTLQNGADAVALYTGDATDFPNGTPVTDAGLVDGIVYDTDDADDPELLATLLNPGQPQVNENGNGNKDFESNQRCPNGEGGARNTDTYIQVEPTADGSNNCPTAEMLINEVDSDTESTDVLEFIELFDGGVGNTPLDGLVVVLFNGNGDVSYWADDLDGYSTDADGYFVLGNEAVPGVDLVFPSNTLQNGADAVALYTGDATDFPNGTPVTDAGLLDAIVYDTDDDDDPELLAMLLNPGQPQVNENGNGNKDFESNQRCPNGSGGLRNTDTYTQLAPTPDGGNTCVFPATIFEIQYTTDPSGDSPYIGLTVTTQGVVTGIFAGGSQVWIQDGTGPWNGLYLYNPDEVPALGDLVEVTGQIDEYFGMTELANGDLTVLSSGEPLPAPEVLPTVEANMELWESVLIRVENVVVTNPDLGYGEWEIDDGSGPLVVDDIGAYTYVPVLNDPLDYVQGPLNYTYSAFKIAPRDDDDIGLPQAPVYLINEVDSDTESTDVLEFIELFDGGVGDTPLDGLVVVMFNGNGDVSYYAADLDGYSTDIDGYFVLGNDAVPGVDLVFPSNTLQNGADAVALYTGDATDFPNGTPVTDVGLLDAIVYDTDDADDPELLATLLNPGQPQVNENGNGNKDFESNQRCPNGEGGARNTDTYTQVTPTPDGANNCEGPGYTPIYDIQYTEDPSGDSPYNGQTVTTQGVVTAVFYGGDQVWIQDGTGAWNGINVYLPDVVPALGDLVEITGDVSEYNGLTEIINSAVTILGSGEPLPTPSVVSTFDVNQEMWESVLVRVENVVVTNPDLGFGEWEIDDGSGPAVVDDMGSYTYVPVLNDPLDYVQGPLNYSFGAFKIEPRDDGDIGLPEPPAILINELDSDTESTDTLEFIELFDDGVGNTPLDGFTVVLFNGNGDVSYRADDLDGYATDANGYFVLGNAAVPGVDLIFPDNTLQNGADAVAIYLADATDFPNGTPVTDINLVDAVVYDTDDDDDPGLLDVLLNPGQPQVNENGNGNKDFDSIQRCPNGSGGPRNTETFSPLAPTPDGENTCVIPVTIFEIQYTTDPGGDSPYNGLTVATEGLVTALYGDDCFIQDGTGPFSGLYLYNTCAGLVLGDWIAVTGTVQEYYNMTEIGYGDVTLVSSGLPLPDPELLPTAEVSQELWESVLVRVEDATVTDPDLGYGEWAVDDGSGPVVIDDMGSYAYVPALGDLLQYIQGPLMYSFDAFKIEPRDDGDILLWLPGPGLWKEAPITVDPGATFIYTLNVENQLGFDLLGVTVTDTVPVNSDFVQAFDGGVLLPGNIVSWSIPSLPHMGSAAVHFEVLATGGLGDEIWNDDYQAWASNWLTPTIGSPILTIIGDYAPIYAIQGDGFESPYGGQVVRTLGVVTGFFEGNTPDGGVWDGFYIQDTAGDGLPGTSDGLLVNYGTLGVSVAVGDLVYVTGLVQEFNDYGDPCPECETQILVSDPANVEPAGTALLPAPVELDPPGDPGDSAVYFESLEGMLTTQPLTVTVVGPTSYGTISVVPGDEGVSRVLRGSPQEGMVYGVRPDERYGSGAPNLIVGSVVEMVDGPLAYTYSAYVVADQDGYTVVYEQPVPDEPEPWPAPGSDQFSVATFNTYNFDDPAGVQMSKVVETVETLNGPSFLVLEEIAVESVMTDLLANLATYNYDYAYSHPDVGGHGVAVVWDQDRVTDAEWSTEYQGCSEYGSSSSTYDPLWDYCQSMGQYPLFSRRPVVVSGTVTTDNGPLPIVVIGNHFKSKLGGAPSDQRRLEQAQFVAELVDQFVAEGMQYVLVAGDLNDFEDSPPLEALYASGNLVSPWFDLPPEARFSYIFGGVSEILDHILVTPALLELQAGFSPLHYNADFPYLPFADDPTVVWRTSDHDPAASTFTRLPTMHVAGIDGVFSVDYLGRVVLRMRVSVEDQSATPLGNVAVDASMWVPDGGPFQRMRYTRPSGNARFHWGSRASGTWTICVDNLTLDGWIYAPEENVVTCMDWYY